MNILYKSKRVGKNGQVFSMYKFRTLKHNVDGISSFAQKDQYTRFGKFLRKTKIDELPQLLNVLKGDMSVFSYRPEEERAYRLLPASMRLLLSQERPGIIDLASLHFMDEESLLQVGDPHKTYWEKVRPLKFTLQMFYMQNRSWLLNAAIIWTYIKKTLWSLFRK